MTSTWETAVFMHNTYLESVLFTDPSCNNNFMQNITHTSVSTNFLDCGTVTTQHDDIITRENVATVTVRYTNAFIERKITYVYVLRCLFDRQLDVVTSNGFLAEDRVFTPPPKNGTSTFGASMDMYQSASFVQVLQVDPVPVATFEPMYIGVRSDNRGVGVKIVVDQCYATPTGGPDDVRYLFFDLKCPIDPTFSTVR